MIRGLDLADRRELLEVLDLQRASYAVEAGLIGTSDIPPLKETVEDLAGCDETFLGRFEGGGLVGAISYKLTKGVLDVHRLMVRPNFFRRGIARSLMGRVERTGRNVDRIVVSTAKRNTPARHLYRTLGYRETGEKEAAPGLLVTSFEKPLRNDRAVERRRPPEIPPPGEDRRPAC